MCLFILALQAVPSYPVMLLFNRDEQYSRPSQSLHLWEGSRVLAPKDLLFGGTWFGINKFGQWAGLTSFRSGEPPKKGAQSRGKLVSAFLQSDQEAKQFIADLQNQSAQYNDFNLVCGNFTEAYWYSSKLDSYQRIPMGIHAISNGFLDVQWPKVKKATDHLLQILNAQSTYTSDELLSIMQDKTLAPDDQLPNTGINRTREKLISGIRVANSDDGTCSSSVLLIDQSNYAHFTELRFLNSEDPGTKTEICLHLSSKPS